VTSIQKNEKNEGMYIHRNVPAHSVCNHVPLEKYRNNQTNLTRKQQRHITSEKCRVKINAIQMTN
jgi:hypothetical protein